MKCRICKSNKNYEVFNLKKQPLANKYPKNRKEIIKEKNINCQFTFVKNVKLLKSRILLVEN